MDEEVISGCANIHMSHGFATAEYGDFYSCATQLIRDYFGQLPYDWNIYSCAMVAQFLDFFLVTVTSQMFSPTELHEDGFMNLVDMDLQ